MKNRKGLAIILCLALTFCSLLGCSNLQRDDLPDNETQQIEEQSSSIRLVRSPGECYPGETASIKIQGKPNTTYSITVRYNSGNSTASGLYDKTSDSKGNVSWSWKVGTRTSSGTYKIRISGGGENFSTTFTVL